MVDATSARDALLDLGLQEQMRAMDKKLSVVVKLISGGSEKEVPNILTRLTALEAIEGKQIWQTQHTKDLERCGDNIRGLIQQMNQELTSARGYAVYCQETANSQAEHAKILERNVNTIFTNIKKERQKLHLQKRELETHLNEVLGRHTGIANQSEAACLKMNSDMATCQNLLAEATDHVEAGCLRTETAQAEMNTLRKSLNDVWAIVKTDLQGSRADSSRVLLQMRRDLECLTRQPCLARRRR